MALDRFMIAPLSTGLETDVKPFLLPEDAFTQLNNAYVFRGRVKKRFGSRLMGSSQLTSRLRINIGTTDSSGNISATVPGAIFKQGQMFSIGTEIFTVAVTGTPGIMLTTGTSTVHTYNTTSGAVVINGAAHATDVFFYPAEPVMGLVTYQIAPINYEELIAFDTQFAYTYTVNGWVRKGAGIWTGSNSQFFWGDSYRGADVDESYLFVTNNTTADKIKYWDGTTWTTFTPALDSVAHPTTLSSARLVIPFDNRLLCLNVIENTWDAGTSAYVPVTVLNRIRFSKDGSPVEADSFISDISGFGSWIDATTKEAIVSARVIRDRLIVFFESSTYELVKTGNPAFPFVFQQLNEELGTESTFSTIIFDKHVLGIGNVGIHACNGASVERIDNKIPDEVFKIANDNGGLDRVHGIRDYATEMVYWTFVPGASGATFPRKVLTFNYKNGAWSFNDDSITCFGYFQNNVGITWADLPMQWQENGDTWSTGAFDAQYQNVLAGNQEGFVFVLAPELVRNSPSLQITDIFNSIATPGKMGLYVRDHNLTIDDFVAIEDPSINPTLIGIFPILSIDGTHTLTLDGIPYFSGLYQGGATLARISRIDIETKHYSFYQKEGLNLYVPTVEFYVDRTEHGEITVDVSTSSSNVSLLKDGLTTDALLGTGVLETKPYALVPLEATQDRFWHRYYPQATGETVQLKLYLSNSQLVDPDIALSLFELNGMVFYASPVTR